MIVFLTLCYVGLLALAVKMGVLKLTLFWKISPILWMVLLLIVLFIPMQWSAPSGSVVAYKPIVEIIPNVSGEVIEVPVEPLVPLKEGDVLFRIDPTPFAARVDQWKSRLEEAKQTVKQLDAAVLAAKANLENKQQEVELAKEEQNAAKAAVDASVAGQNEAAKSKLRFKSITEDLIEQVRVAQVEFDRIQSLTVNDAVSLSERDRAQIQLTSLKLQLNTANIDVTIADEGIAAAEANLRAAQAQQRSADLSLKQLVETDIPRAEAELARAEYAANARIGSEHTLVATARAELEAAEFDLQETVVRAPTAGYVAFVSLREGQRVGNLPVRSWMTFVKTNETVIAAGIPQFVSRHIEIGQTAELTFKVFPGQVYQAEVDGLFLLNSSGQYQPTGVLQEAPGGDGSALPFTVRLKLTDPNFSLEALPGGSSGTVAVYTETGKATHLIRRVMIRMDAWMNYVFP